MNENILTWNLPNWISVTLMGLVGFALLAAATGVVRKKMSSQKSS